MKVKAKTMPSLAPLNSDSLQERPYSRELTSTTSRSDNNNNDDDDDDDVNNSHVLGGGDTSISMTHGEAQQSLRRTSLPATDDAAGSTTAESSAFLFNASAVLRHHHGKEQTSPSVGMVSSNDGVDGPDSNNQDNAGCRLLCLNPWLSLKQQLFWSFQSVSVLSLAFVVVAAVLIALQAGGQAKTVARQTFQTFSQEKMVVTTLALSESITEEFRLYSSLTAFLEEMTKDRFAGYPDYTRTDSDAHVPFHDVYTGQNVYPLQARQLLPFDWQLNATDASSTDPDIQRLFVGRAHWYEQEPVSMTEPSFHVYRNTDMVPSTMVLTGLERQIHEKVSDYAAAVLKPLYEIHRQTKSIGLHFVNDGAGATVIFPGHQLQDDHDHDSHSNNEQSMTSIQVSEGCAWLLEPNPFNTSKTIGTLDQVSKCRAAGSVLTDKVPNPLETGWCRRQALHPFDFHIDGPYPDTHNPAAVHDTQNGSHQQWLLSVGHAVYDRITNDFIACTRVELNLERVATVLEDAVPPRVKFGLFRWDDAGTVVKGYGGQTTSTARTYRDVGISDAAFAQMKDQVEAVLIYHTSDGEDDMSTPGVIVVDQGMLYSAYAVPTPPAVYDPSYRPEFLVVLQIDEDVIFRSVNTMSNAVDNRVESIVVTTLLAGCLGLLIVSLCIYVVALALTQPMRYIHKTGDDVVQSFGSATKDTNRGPIGRAAAGGGGNEQDNKDWPSSTTTAAGSFWLKYSPPTEITKLLREFDMMMQHFSGQGTAQLDFHRDPEVKNPFPAESVLKPLYKRRANTKFLFDERYGALKVLPEMYRDNCGTIAGTVCGRLHWGPNSQTQIKEGMEIALGHDSGGIDNPNNQIDNGNNKKGSIGSNNAKNQTKRICASALFWWILLAIGLPLLLVMIGISVRVTYDLTQVFPDILDELQEVFVAFEVSSLLPLATVRAHYTEIEVGASFQDLHMLYRITGWLFFGGLLKSNSYTEMHTEIERCKGYPNDLESCPFYNKFEAVCDCGWSTANREATSKCYEYDKDPRALQKLWWMGSTEIDGPDGDVSSTRYPEVAYSPATTSWWSNQTSVPGSDRGLGAPNGYRTTFQALRNIAATSLVHIPSLNYQASTEGKTVGSMVAVKDKGILSGYTGCDHSHAGFATFPSNDKTGAYKFNPIICPKGKFGYDPRCRNWWSRGVRQHLKDGTAYLSPPYLFAGTNRIHQLGTMPLIDPNTEEYVGQSIVDLDSAPIIEALSSSRTPMAGDGFPIMASSTRDSFGTDTVVAPGFSLALLRKEKSGPLEKFVLPYDHCTDEDRSGCDRIASFTVIRERMQAGLNGTDSFIRTDANGNEEEVFLAYSPVKTRSLRAVNHSDFDAGVEEYETRLFSVGFAQTRPSLLNIFAVVEDDLNQTANLSFPVLVSCIVLAFIAATIMSGRVAVSIIRPVGDLLDAITDINNKKHAQQEAHDEMPHITGGSREVGKIRDTFERLHMVVRFANSAFYSGDLVVAYETLKKALAVFRRLNNEKAIGVAHNNLGNTMMTIYRTLKETAAPSIMGMNKGDVVRRGVDHLTNAIDIGEEALSTINKVEGWSNNYLVFMQQLSNRYFNRAMFLLTARNDHPHPEEAESQGQQDLLTAKDMDCEVVNNGDRYGFKGDDDVYFELLVMRLRGLINLAVLGYDDTWGIEELLDEARAFLNNALKEPSKTALFRELEPAGQMQRLDGLTIRYYTHVGKKEEAALVAIRMLQEDEYVVGKKALLAVKAVIDYLPEMDLSDISQNASDLSSSLFQYRRIISEELSPKYDPHGAGRSDLLTSSAAARRSSVQLVMNQCVKSSNVGDLSLESF